MPDQETHDKFQQFLKFLSIVGIFVAAVIIGLIYWIVQSIL